MTYCSIIMSSFHTRILAPYLLVLSDTAFEKRGKRQRGKSIGKQRISIFKRFRPPSFKTAAAVSISSISSSLFSFLYQSKMTKPLIKNRRTIATITTLIFFFPIVRSTFTFPIIRIQSNNHHHNHYQIEHHSSRLSMKSTEPTSSDRRTVLLAGSFLGGIFGSGNSGSSSAAQAAAMSSGSNKNKPTNQIVKKINGMKQRRLGGSDILVSEMGLGTQRWVSTDFNAPDETACFEFMDLAILKKGVNLIDTAEQYPIPSDGIRASEGDSERLIGKWIKERNVPRQDVVIATKITGGRNVTPKNIIADCEGSLQRLGTDYIDVYQLHWPQRYSPQSNWGQSMAYNIDNDSNPYWRGMGGPTSFEDLCTSMEKLIQTGKIRGWGLCNDNAYGLTACTRTAKALGTTPPCTLQGDYSLLDRKSEENGVSEAASPYNENVGFMAYNALAGGMLTGKYMNVPAALDNRQSDQVQEALRKPRGRMDTRGWGNTLYRYRTTAATAAIAEYAKIAKKYKIASLTELSLRWCRQRSLITTTLLGHSNIDQLKETLEYFTIEEPLSDEIMWEIDVVHMKNRLPLFSSDRVGLDWYGSGEIGETIP